MVAWLEELEGNFADEATRHDHAGKADNANSCRHYMVAAIETARAVRNGEHVTGWHLANGIEAPADLASVLAGVRAVSVDLGALHADAGELIAQSDRLALELVRLRRMLEAVLGEPPPT